MEGPRISRQDTSLGSRSGPEVCWTIKEQRAKLPEEITSYGTVWTRAGRRSYTVLRGTFEGAGWRRAFLVSEFPNEFPRAESSVGKFEPKRGTAKLQTDLDGKRIRSRRNKATRFIQQRCDLSKAWRPNVSCCKERQAFFGNKAREGKIEEVAGAEEA